MKHRLIFLMFLGVIVMLIAGCAQQETTKPAPSETPTPSEVQTSVPSKEYVTLKELAEKIRSGEIDVGNDYSMSLNGRFHTIHSKVLGLDCSACHVSSYAEDYIYQGKYEKSGGAPGVVDRSTCLGCHKEGGIATPWYGSANK